MKKRLLFLLVLMVAVLVLVMSCSDTTEPKRDVSTPTFNPPGGTYTEGQQVTINCETEGAVIKHTIDGTVTLFTSLLSMKKCKRCVWA